MIGDDPCSAVEGVKVTFVDANHCPGAVMMVFDDIPGGSGPVLATGDCRYHSAGGRLFTHNTFFRST